MYGQYIAAIVCRAFQPTARFTDVLQILAASAAPAIARFLGVAVPAPDETLAYIGATAVAFVALRLFFVAPYQVWREQVGELGTLRVELSRPERLELEHLAQIRAKQRMKMATLLREMVLTLLRGEIADPKPSIINGHQQRFLKLDSQITLPPDLSALNNAIIINYTHAFEEIKAGRTFAGRRQLIRSINYMICHLNGKPLTIAVPALPLPQDTAPETQP